MDGERKREREREIYIYIYMIFIEREICVYIYIYIYTYVGNAAHTPAWISTFDATCIHDTTKASSHRPRNSLKSEPEA